MRNEKWASSVEKEKVLKAGAAGPVLWHSDEKLYTYDKEGHILFLGVSGVGKSRRGTIPMVASVIQNHESGVFVDPKGELYRETKGFIGEDYDVHVINFRALFENNCEGWNPLWAPYELWKTGGAENIYQAEQMVEELSHAMYPVAGGTDPFWAKEARNVFLGAVYALFACASPEQVNLASVHYLISKGEETYGTSTYLKEFISFYSENENIAMQLQGYVTTAKETRAGIRSVFLDGLSIATKSESVRKFLSHDELHINRLAGEKPTLIYIILPDETPVYDELTGVLVFQIMNHYVKLAEQRYGGKLPVRVNFVLEELGNIGRAITNLPHLLSAGRSRNIRVGLVLQSISQLVDIYGASNATTIMSNCDVRIAFRVNHWDTLTELSRMCGEREIMQEGHCSREPLITQSQLAAMETGQALVMIAGRTKFITWLPDYKEMFEVPKRKKHLRKKIQFHIEKGGYFDIKEYVKEVKKEKVMGILKEGREKAEKRKKERWEEVFGIEMPEMNSGSEPPYLDMDVLLAGIDGKIEELEKEENKEECCNG